MGHTREQLARLVRHVPPHTLASVLEQPDRDFPALERREGSLLRAEIAGVEALADALYSRGHVGGEELARVVGQLFDRLLQQALMPAGAWVMRFSGQALTAVFEGPAHAQRAAWCAAEVTRVAREASTLSTGAGDQPIRLRASTATGPYALIYLGIGHDHVACVPGGATVQRCLELASVTPWGSASAGPESFAAVPGLTRAAEIKGGFVVGSVPPMSPQPLPDLEDMLARVSPPAIERLFPFVPDPVRAAVEDGGSPIADIRKAPCLIARMPPSDWDGSRAVADARAAGEIFRNAVVAIRRLGGRVGPVETALDGHHLLALFAGTNRSELERAARCALELKGLGLSVALELGSTFLGELGAAQRELGALGESLGMAERLLSVARLGDAVVGPVIRSQLWGFGIELLPTIRLDDRGSTVPGLLLAAPEPQALRARPRTSEASVAVPSLVGRARETALVHSAAQQVRAGSGASGVIVVGESGVGKSAIVDSAVSEWSSSGSSSAIARCTFADAERPWALAGRLMRQLLRLPSDTDPDRAPDAVSRFDPRLSTVAPYSAVLLGAPGAATMEAIAELLEGIIAHRASDAPLLLAVDNAQYSDPSSSQVLNWVAKRLVGSPVLWMVSGTQVAREWLGDTRAERLEVQPLPMDVAVAVIRRLEPALSDDAARQCAEVGAGNPFRMQAAARLLLSGRQPRTGADLLGVWVQGLDETPRLMAELIAVFGGARAGVEVLHEALREFDRHANGRDALLAVEKRDLLERRLGKLRFRVRAVQEAIYEGLTPERSRALHGAVGRALKMHEPDSPAALFAFHFSRSDSVPEAVRSGLRAGEDAMRAGALVEAATLFGSSARAAEAGRAPELSDALARQARALSRLGRDAEVLPLAQRAVTAARASGRKRPLAEALAAAANAALHQGDAPRSEELIVEGAEAAAWTRDTELSIEVYGLASRIFSMRAKPRQATRYARQALRLAGAQDSPGSLAQARAAIGFAALCGGHGLGAAREFAEAQRLFSVSGEAIRATEVAVERALALISAQQPDRAAVVLREALPTGDIPGQLRGLVLYATGLIDLEQGRWKEAERGLSEAKGALGPPLRARSAIAELVARALDGSTSAEEALEAMSSAPDQSADSRANALIGLARCEVLRGRPGEARARLEQAESLARISARDLLPAVRHCRDLAASAESSE